MNPSPKTTRAHRLVGPVLGSLACLVLAAGCTHHIDVQPIRVEPIHLTVDVNLRVDRELEESFGFEDRIAQQSQTAPATAPASAAPPTGQPAAPPPAPPATSSSVPPATNTVGGE